jgi:hypothetical protein
VAEGARLESVYVSNGIGGSNPPLSAIHSAGSNLPKEKGRGRASNARACEHDAGGHSHQNETAKGNRASPAVGPVPSGGSGSNRVRPGTEQP